MPLSKLSDEELMNRLCDGQDEALSPLISRWRRRLLAFATRYTQNETDAHDITQETFIKVYKSRKKYRVNGCFQSWILTIAANLCKNHHRWKKRHPSESLDATDSVCFLSGTPIPKPPDHLANSKDRVKLTKTAIQKLPHKLKAPLILSVYENLSQSEIANILNCSVKAVETRLYRARNILHQDLKKLL